MRIWILLAVAALALADPSHFAGRHTKREPEPVAELPAVLCPAATFTSTLRVLESSSLTDEQPHVINFEITSALDASGFVDLHYKINSGEVVNVRMNKLSEKSFNFGNIMLKPGDKLEYQFTYCIQVNGRQVDCDTEWFTFEMPRPQPVMTKTHKPEPVAELPPITCPALTFSQAVALSASADASSEAKLHEIKFEITSNIDASGFVDLHYKINSGELVNVRMNKLSEKLFNFELLLSPGDKLEYFMTYCVMINGRQVDCDTEWFSFEMPRPQPVMTKKEKPSPVEETPALQCPVLTVEHSLVATGLRSAEGELEHILTFDSSSNLEMLAWVDLHYKINDGELVNVRMLKVSDARFELPLNLSPGDKLDWFFTYCVMIGGRAYDCDTEWFSSQIARPQPVMTKKHKPEPVAELPAITCPALTFSQAVALSASADASSEAKLHEIKFEITSDIDASGFVDLHYKINSGELVNVRMNKLSEKLFNFELLLSPGDKLEYFMTYCVMINGRQVDCDTEWFSFEMPRPQPVMTKKEKPAPVQEMCSKLDVGSSLLSTGLTARKKEGSMLKLRFESRTDISAMGFVDLHYAINGGELFNVRMNKLTDKVWEYELPELKTGDKLNFFFTYCYQLGSLLCDFNTDIEIVTIS